MRVKTVYKTHEIAGLWLSRVTLTARNQQGTFYFDGPTIYSYGRHFPVARHVVNENGHKAILLTTETYSNTTAKHVGAVRSAIFYGANCPIFRVELRERRGLYERDQVQAQFTKYQAQVLSLMLKAKRARKYQAYTLKDCLAKIGEANQYAKFYGLAERLTFREWPKWFMLLVMKHKGGVK